MSGLAKRMREALGCAYVLGRGLTCLDPRMRANWPICPACIVLRDATPEACAALDSAAERPAKLETALNDVFQEHGGCPCAACMDWPYDDSARQPCLLVAVWAAMSDSPSTPKQEKTK